MIDRQGISGCATRLRDMGGRFADEFQISEGRLIGNGAEHERRFIHLGGVGLDFGRAFDHVVNK